MTDEGRPQDVGRRRNRAKGDPSPATAALLERYQSSMRAELATLLDDLGGSPAPAGLLDGDDPLPIMRPSLGDRSKIWALAIQLGRELGSAIDAPPAETGAAAARPRRRRAEY